MKKKVLTGVMVTVLSAAIIFVVSFVVSANNKSNDNCYRIDDCEENIDNIWRKKADNYEIQLIQKDLDYIIEKIDAIDRKI